MTPALSLQAVREDDELLDLLAARAGGAAAGEPLVVLLAALAADVDEGLDAVLNPLAAAADTPAAEVAELVEVAVLDVADERAVARRPDDAGEPADDGGRRAVVSVGRGGAIVAALALVCASAGVAAAVSGDPAGAFGVRTVEAVINHHRAASPAAVERLEHRIAEAASRRGGASPTELAALRAEAALLPDGGGPDVRRRLDALATRGAAAAPTTSPATGAGARVRVSLPGGPGGSGRGDGRGDGRGEGRGDGGASGAQSSAEHGQARPEPGKAQGSGKKPSPKDSRAATKRDASGSATAGPAAKPTSAASGRSHSGDPRGGRHGAKGAKKVTAAASSRGGHDGAGARDERHTGSGGEGRWQHGRRP